MPKGKTSALFFFFFLIEHGNLPNCCLDSNTVTTCKVWRPVTFRPVRPLYDPRVLPFFSFYAASLHCHLRQSVPLCTPYSVYLRSLAPQMISALGYALETFQTQPSLSFSFTMRKQAGN